MKKTSAFQEAKPRTPKAEAMADLLELDDEETYKRILAEKFGIKPGNPRYQKAMATWAEIRRAQT
jgi:hypothetical protein